MVKEEISMFEADYGGTQIREPLDSIFTTKLSKEYKKRIFILTDGGVWDKA